MEGKPPSQPEPAHPHPPFHHPRGLLLEHLRVLVYARHQAHAYRPPHCLGQPPLVDWPQACLTCMLDPARRGHVFGDHGEVLCLLVWFKW